MARRTDDDTAGAETVGALILFGIFVATIAYLNVTAVPQAGLAGEESHFLGTVGNLNALQSSAEAAASPSGAGTTVSQALMLGPTQTAGSDFFSFFVATPAKASGELAFNSSYGGITVYHEEASAGRVYDVGSAAGGLPFGQLRFDPHPIFRNAGVISLENGALVTTDGATQTLRYAPPITATQAGGVTSLSVKTRLLNGTTGSVGGGGPARVGLTSEAATLSAAPAANAVNVTLIVQTSYGTAWGAYLNTTAISGGLPAGSYTTSVARGAGPGGLDVVVWRVEGTGTGNDVRFSHGLAILDVSLN